MTTTVRLLSHTAYPLETLYACWELSRHNNPVPTPKELAYTVGCPASGDEALGRKIEQTVREIIASGIPVAENVSFLFEIDGMPISLREQMVRHRVGHHFGDRLGCDIVPDLADSTWWSQSMRILPMDKFAAEGHFHIPKSIVESGATVREPDGKMVPVAEFFKRQMFWIQSAISKLVKAGIPLEDARELVPLGATHRITWSINLAALQHVIGKRGCWILQLGVWEPVIRGMVEALATELHPLFRELIKPPCIGRNGEFERCHFNLDNTRRVQGEDEIPPCSLWVNKETVPDAGELNGPRAWRLVSATVEGRTVTRAAPVDPATAERKKARQRDMERDYAALWGRDVFTGDKV